MKKILVFSFVLILLIGIISAEDNLEKTIIKLENGEIIISEIGGVKVNYENGLITFPAGENNYDVCVNGLCFENILPQDKVEENLQAITMDPKTGKIETATLTFGEKGGICNLGDGEFPIPAWGRVKYNSKYDDTIEIACKKDSKVTEIAQIGGITYYGDDIEFPGGLMIKHGIIKTEKNGYFVEQGDIVFKQNVINAIKNRREQILLVTNPDADMSNYNCNWIRQTKEKLEIQSAYKGSININFLENHEILNTNINNKLSAKITYGDGLIFENRVENGLPPLVKHKQEDYGKTLIVDDGLKLIFDINGFEMQNTQLTLDEIYSGQYQSVSLEIESDLLKNNEKIKIDSNSQISMFSEDGKEIVKFRKKGLSELLQKGLTKEQIDERAKEIEKVVSAKYSKNVIENSLPTALQAGLNSEQTVDLIKETMKRVPKDDIDTILTIYLPNILKDASWAGLNSEQTVDLIKETMKMSGGGNNAVDLLRFDLPKVLSATSKTGLNSEQTVDLIKETMKVSKNSWALSTNFARALKEYNGNNFEDLKQGILVTTKYSQDNSFFPSLIADMNLKYTDIKDKNSLTTQFTNSLNLYYKGNSAPNTNMASTAALTINIMHDNEGFFDKEDTIRQTIAKKTNFETKYYLIAQSQKDELYPSTFDALYNNFPKNSIEQIKQIDKNGKLWGNFVMQTSGRSKTNELLKQDPYFFVEVMERELNKNQNNEELMEKGGIFIDTFIELYENSEYEEQKEYVEQRLIEKYNQAQTNIDKGIYGYLLKLNKNPSPAVINELNRISNELPEISIPTIPKKLTEDNIISAKYYFYDDEAWFQTTIREYTKKGGDYEFTRVDNKKNSQIVVLEKIINGRTIKVVLTTDKSDTQQAIEGDEFDIIAHRGHYFNTKDTFSGSSDSEKIFFLGGCDSFFVNSPEVEQKYPKAHIISEKNTGEGAVSNYATYILMEKLAQGKTDWEDLKYSAADKKGLVYPNDKSQLLTRFIRQIV